MLTVCVNLCVHFLCELLYQDDEFCGPKPIRPPVEEAPETGGLAAAMSGGLSGLGGGMMSGRDILALLQGMSMGGGLS